jgi:F0F1-type ATP synthase alpha subunit
VWEQTAMLLAANEGCFDPVPLEKIKEAQHALLTRLAREHKKEMTELNKGDKPTEATQKLIVKLANDIFKSYAVQATSKGAEKEV